MHPIFYGFGPVFRRNIQAEPFRSVDIYPLMSYILQLKERKTNGSFENVKNILQDFSEEKFFNKIYLFISKLTADVTSWGLISKYIHGKFYLIYLMISFLAVGCLILVLLISIVFIIAACRRSRQLIYVEPPFPPVRYRLLSNNEESANNLVASESENDEVIG
jgi:hypothetical protein